MRFHSVVEEAGENSVSAQHDAGAFRCAVKSAVGDGEHPGLYCLLADFREGDTSPHGGNILLPCLFEIVEVAGFDCHLLNGQAKARRARLRSR